MEPVKLRSDRLVLSVPRAQDHDRVYEYCRDPLFEGYMTLPWPYKPSDATFFIEQLVPRGWEQEREYTWALRENNDGELLGMIGSRVQEESGTVDVGYWLGAPHRGRGLMTEAVNMVVDWLFQTGRAERVLWECVAGNVASAAVARAAGFRYTATAPSRLTMRDGTRRIAWHGIRLATGPEADLSPTPWPAETFTPPA